MLDRQRHQTGETELIRRRDDEPCAGLCEAAELAHQGARIFDVLDSFTANNRVGDFAGQRYRARVELGLAKFDVRREPRISDRVDTDTLRKARAQAGPQLALAAAHIEQQVASEVKRFDHSPDKSVDRRLAISLALQRTRDLGCPVEMKIHGFL